jgi:choline dehydrogenase-like flavoprotein
MMWVRGCRADYDEWARLAGPDWSYSAVLPYFQRIEATEQPGPEHGGSGPMAVSRQRDPSPLTSAYVTACREVGLSTAATVNGADVEGVVETRVTQRDGQRWSAADAYLRSAARRPNLTVLTSSHASRVSFDGRRATGVEYLRGGRRHRAAATREVVLCGGTVNSPQLLMLSGVGPAQHIRRLGIPVVHDLAAVGCNLRDHLLAKLVIGCRKPITLSGARSPSQVARYLRHRRGMLTSNVAEAYAFVRSTPELTLPDLELIFAPAPLTGEQFAGPSRHGFTLGAVLLQPQSTGTVRLASADPFAAPRIDPRYLTDPAGADRSALEVGLDWCERLRAAPALAWHGQGQIEPPEAAGERLRAAAIDQYAHTFYHPVGTCRMGSDPGSVVDPQLRVRGTTGLRIADASVMPTLIRGHTNAPAILIGERAADLIREAAR